MCSSYDLPYNSGHNSEEKITLNHLWPSRPGHDTRPSPASMFGVRLASYCDHLHHKDLHVLSHTFEAFVCLCLDLLQCDHLNNTCRVESSKPTASWMSSYLCSSKSKPSVPWRCDSHSSVCESQMSVLLLKGICACLLNFACLYNFLIKCKHQGSSESQGSQRIA